MGREAGASSLHPARPCSEIGIALALGLRSWQLLRAFVEEAFLVVLGASLLGAAIGAVVAWAFGQQQSLFTAIPV